MGTAVRCGAGAHGVGTHPTPRHTCQSQCWESPAEVPTEESESRAPGGGPARRARGLPLPSSPDTAAKTQPFRVVAHTHLPVKESGSWTCTAEPRRCQLGQQC